MCKKEKGNKIPEYDDYNICPKCGNHNTVDITETVNHTVCECSTICNSCGHEDYWAYGFYESGIITYDEFKSNQKGE